MKKRLCLYSKIFVGILILMSLVSALNVPTYADTETHLIMKYQNTTYNKTIYGAELPQIIAGENSLNMQGIDEVCNHVYYCSNYKTKINAAAVKAAVRNAVTANMTTINIDLANFVEGAVTPAVVSTPKNTTVSSATPAPTSDALAAIGIDTQISQCSTSYSASQDRAVNIVNAASKINGIILQPGQAFSCDLYFMPRSPLFGYGPGNTIVNGQTVKSIGGGICQVSSTLNVAVLRAGIIPTERHCHGTRSSYLKAGLDATISEGTLDYCFVNTLKYPICIAATAVGGTLTVSILSNHAALGGITYQPVVIGEALNNATYVCGYVGGAQVSSRLAYTSKYKK